MKKFIATIVTAAVAVSMVSGCGKGTKLTEPTGTTSETTALTEASASTSESWEPHSFEELYGEQLMGYLDHQYYFDGQPVPLEESNFYFVNSFLDLANYAGMGYYPATVMGYLDLSAECPEGSEFATYGDFFVKYAENSLEESLVLNARAAKEGKSLSDETEQAIDDMLESIKTTSAANTNKTLEEYLQFWYGPSVTEENFRAVLERYYLADVYSKLYCEDYQFTDAQKMSDYPYVRYVLFMAPQETATDAEKEEALKLATDLKNQCKSLDDITTLGDQAVELGTATESNDIDVRGDGSLVPEFEAWGTASHKVGDIDVIYCEAYGYFVVGYLGIQEKSKSELDQIALSDLSKSIMEEIDSGVHDFHTDDPYLPAAAAPTPTTAPAGIYSEDDNTLQPAASDISVPVASETTDSKTNTTEVLVIVFITLAAVAVAAVVVILIVYALRNGKSSENVSKKPARRSYDDDDDENEEPVVSRKSRSSKKFVEEDDEEDDDEEDDEEAEEEDEDEE